MLISVQYRISKEITCYVGVAVREAIMEFTDKIQVLVKYINSFLKSD